MANDLEGIAREIITRLPAFFRAISRCGPGASSREGQEHYRAQQYHEAARGIMVDRMA